MSCSREIGQRPQIYIDIYIYRGGGCVCVGWGWVDRRMDYSDKRGRLIVALDWVVTLTISPKSRDRSKIGYAKQKVSND